MKRKSVVPKPFRKGRCVQCYETKNTRYRNLCPDCLSYAEQDYVPQRNALVSAESLEDLAALDAQHARNSNDESGTLSCPEYSRKHTLGVFKKAGVTATELKVMRLTFAEGRTFLDVSKLLGVSKSSIQTHVNRVREKLRSCHTRALLSKGEHFSQPIRTQSAPLTEDIDEDLVRALPLASNEEEEKEQGEEGETAAPPRSRPGGMRAVCPRCRDRIFSADRDFQYCFSCLWTSDGDVYQIESQIKKGT